MSYILSDATGSSGVPGKGIQLWRQDATDKTDCGNMLRRRDLLLLCRHWFGTDSWVGCKNVRIIVNGTDQLTNIVHVTFSTISGFSNQCSFISNERLRLRAIWQNAKFPSILLVKVTNYSSTTYVLNDTDNYLYRFYYS